MNPKKNAKPTKRKNELVSALVANPAGEIFELNGYAAVGMAGSMIVPLTLGQTRSMPYGSEFMYLPDRSPILFNMRTGEIETLKVNPYVSDEPIFPVTAFNSPGHVISYVGAYCENNSAGFLPLFSYGAVGWYRGKFRSAIILVDRERRQDLRLMKQEDVAAGIKKLRRQLPTNRLRAHLEKCALQYGCPAGKNLFLGRYEAPLPAAKHCNARCLGCLSSQKHSEIPHSQDRIMFTPSADEITEVALSHIKRVKKSVVSFGQGCEGDPLLVADVIESAIRRIRSETSQGTINMNTNGSRPHELQSLIDAGMDSIRISINSVRKACYNAYFQPKGYAFADVLKSIDMALEHGIFVSINYLSCPGFTDSQQEMEAFIKFLQNHPIHMIQWRNLNFDPLRYWKTMSAVSQNGTPIGMQKLLNKIREECPNLKFGYFNPPKEKFLDSPQRQRAQNY